METAIEPTNECTNLNDENNTELTNQKTVTQLANDADVDAEIALEGKQQLECENEVQSQESPKKAEAADQSAQDKSELELVNEQPVKEKEKAEHEPPTGISYADLKAQDEQESKENKDSRDILSHVHCLAQLEEQRRNYERQLEQLRTSNMQKDNMMTLLQRENAILEKEKQAFRNEMDLANKEKESTVIKFAMKEKLLIDAKKEKETVEKQLADAKKEVKNVSIRFQAVHEEKSRMTYIIDEKCNEVRKYQRECEKLKTEMGHLESKLKYHANKLNIEVEAKANLERKLEEERNAPNKLEEKANEKLKMEFEANTILLKHEIKSKTDSLDKLSKEHQKQCEANKELQQQLQQLKEAHDQLSGEFKELQAQHSQIDAAYSDELLNAAKLHSQLAELQLLRTQNTINERKLVEAQTRIEELESLVQDNEVDLKQVQEKRQELLNINKEMTELIVKLQNDIYLAEVKSLGFESENKLLKQELLAFDAKYLELEEQMHAEGMEKIEERLLLAKHLSEKTKMYEVVNAKLEELQNHFEATKHKHATQVKELQRELQKYKKGIVDAKPAGFCRNCQQAMNDLSQDQLQQQQQQQQQQPQQHPQQQLITHSRSSSQCSRASESSESETVVNSVSQAQPAAAPTTDLQAVPSKKVLVERILRLQQASARQTERIEFLENHTQMLVSEVQKKSKVVQHYMLRDQTAGALTTSKSDQNKSELVKYGNGVMAAIYGGVKGAESKGMSLELSLEINKKLQAVLEDTLLKNITLKENLDVLGLEVDNLTRKLRSQELSNS
ncbi:hypothetical protein AWZ03_005492 [Drosophila navojoa]|uniref:Coiled-coil domain-containing protein 186 n=1 Tax=Drosophila navojoa TaxID=7232 RepID=A0A484BJU2_DRONA|nr:coiled-coil domain-containing protein 186 [Drosophila navojoa]TDG48075.1 hypothetical protein AWZ03_005492 [Drosophila navojoa]